MNTQAEHLIRLHTSAAGISNISEETIAYLLINEPTPAGFVSHFLWQVGAAANY
jgi:hypothetical protein